MPNKYLKRFNGTSWDLIKIYAFDSDKLEGHSASYFATSTHTHSTYSNIIDVFGMSATADRFTFDLSTRKISNTTNRSKWDSQVYSNYGYKSDVYISYRVGQTNKYIMAGLDSDPAGSASYEQIDYCWYTQGGGGLCIFESGNQIQIDGHTTYASDDEFKIEYSNGQIRYYHNGVLCRTVNRNIGAKLNFDSSFYNGGYLYAVNYGVLTNHQSLSDYATQTWVTNKGYTTNTGTVTKVSTGAGLTGGDVTTTGTIKCKLDSETSLGTLGTTSKLYAIGVDANGKLCVNVPWTDTDTNTHNTHIVYSGKKYDGTTDISSGTASNGNFTLGDSGVTAGWYRRVYVNAKGVVVSGDQTDTDTDTLVTQEASTTSDFRSILLGYDHKSTASSLGGSTNQAYYAAGIYAKPSDGSLYASKLFDNGNRVLTAHPTITTSTDTTSTASPSHGGTFTVVDSVTRDSNGHVTKVNTKTITLPGDNNTWRPVGTGATDAAAGNHTHGNISNDGKVASTAVTSASGIVVIDSNNAIQRVTNMATFRTIIGAGTSSFTGYTSSNKLSTSYIQNDAGWTTNAGTVTSVRVQAGTGLVSSVNTAQSSTLSTTISIDSGYKLPTTTEWANKSDTGHTHSYAGSASAGGPANNITYTTTAPTANNTDGLKICVLSSDPATKYTGWLYIITG